MKIKRLLMVAIVLIFLFCIPVMAKDSSNEYGMGYLYVNYSGGMRNVDAGTVRKNAEYTALLMVRTYYEDGTDWLYDSGKDQEDKVYSHSWEWTECYDSYHRVWETFPDAEYVESFHES